MSVQTIRHNPLWPGPLAALVLLSLFLLSACPLGRGSKQLGEPCDSNNECAAARCEDKVCTTGCKGDADCASAKTRMTCQDNAVTETNPEGWGLCQFASP